MNMEHETQACNMGLQITWGSGFGPQNKRHGTCDLGHWDRAQELGQQTQDPENKTNTRCGTWDRHGHRTQNTGHGMEHRI